MSDWTPPPPSGPPPAAPPANPTHNPYAPPSANVAFNAAAPADAERIRHELLSHEASIRSIGTLYGIGFVFGGIATIGLVLFSIYMLFSDGTSEFGSAAVLFGLTGFYALITALNYVLAKGLRALDPKVRTLATVLSVIGLIGFPIGTLISLYILYLLHSAKGKRVMTSEYQAIVAQTPHIKYKTPVWVILFVVIILVGFVTLAVIAVI